GAVQFAFDGLAGSGGNQPNGARIGATPDQFFRDVAGALVAEVDRVVPVPVGGAGFLGCMPADLDLVTVTFEHFSNFVERLASLAGQLGGERLEQDRPA